MAKKKKAEKSEAKKQKRSAGKISGRFVAKRRVAGAGATSVNGPTGKRATLL